MIAGAALHGAHGGLGLEQSLGDKEPFEAALGNILSHPDELLGPALLAHDIPPSTHNEAITHPAATAPALRQPMLRSRAVVSTSLPTSESPSAKQLSWTPKQCSEGPQCGQRPGSSIILGSQFCCQPGCSGCLIEHSALTFHIIKVTCQCSSGSKSSTNSVSRSSNSMTVSPTQQEDGHGDHRGHNKTDAVVTETDDAAVNVPAAARSLLYILLAVVVCACLLLGAVYVYFMRHSTVKKHLKKKAEHESVEALRHAFRQSELRSLLAQVEDEENAQVTSAAPRAPAAGVDGGVQASAQQRADADREVERVLSAPTAREVLGTGSAAERTAKFRQLVRLIHPDKGLVSGERANLALRRVVEARHELDDAA